MRVSVYVWKRRAERAGMEGVRGNRLKAVGNRLNELSVVGSAFKAQSACVLCFVSRLCVYQEVNHHVEGARFETCGVAAYPPVILKNVNRPGAQQNSHWLGQLFGRRRARAHDNYLAASAQHMMPPKIQTFRGIFPLRCLQRKCSHNVRSCTAYL
jgi:hypothetical protein